MKTTYVIVVIAVIAIVGALIGYNINKPEVPVGSTVQGNDYNATTTTVAIQFVDILLKGGYGALGSVIVTGANTTWFQLLNATTTDVNKRTGNKATSTIVLSTIPASLAAGTYVYDVSFTDGLYLDVLAAGVGTTTITWR